MKETPPQTYSTFASAAGIFLGCSAIGGSILYAVFAGFTLLPFCLSVLAGVILGVPLIYLGLKLDPNNTSESKRFWPSKESFIRFGWDVLAIAALVSVPVILVPTFWLIPAGDGWAVAITRILLLAFFFAATFTWVTKCPPLLGRWFRGRASDKAVDELEKLFQLLEAKPFRLSSALWNCLSTLVLAAIAFSIVFGFVDFNDKWLQLNINGPKRFRGLARLLMWCRGNPNSTWSTSLLVGVGALGTFIYQVADCVARKSFNR